MGPRGAVSGRVLRSPGGRAGRDRSFETAAAKADPVTRYAAFISDQIRHRPTMLDIDLIAHRNKLHAEAARLRRDAASQWEAGKRLAAALPSG